MAYIVRLGSMSVVARTASVAIRMVETFHRDDPHCEPMVSNFDGAILDVERLRRIVVDIDDA